MKERSEKHILHRLVEEVNYLNKIIGMLHELESSKSKINRKIAEGIRKNGKGYEKELGQLKKNASVIISKQKDKIYLMRKIITKIRHLISLLINLEQASLAIHNDLKKDELSSLIDFENMPLDQFRVELEHVDTLKANLELLLVELTKQENYIEEFSLESLNIDENNFYRSQRYISIISNSGIGSVWELKNFCSSMDTIIKNKLKNKHKNLTESDRVAHELMEEIKKVKIKRGLIFSYSFYDFTKSFVDENMSSKNLRKVVLFLLLFLLSRLKKFDAQTYYSQLRATIMTYTVLEKRNESEKRKNILAGACLLRRINTLNLPKIENETDFKEELGVVRKYYKTVNMFLDLEFPFINKVLDVLQKKSGEYDSPLHWVDEGAKLIKVIYEIDKKLAYHSFDDKYIDKNRKSIQSSIEKRHKTYSKEIEYLLRNWDNLLPKNLRN